MKYLDRVLQRWRAAQAAPFIEPGASILDIGCADGFLFRFICNYGDSIGIDPEPVLLDDAIPRVTFYRGLFPDALPRHMTFDVITMLAVLEHVPPDRQEKLAADCASHLKPGGKLIITVPGAAVDHILAILARLGLIDGMSLEQHYGFDARSTPDVFTPRGFDLAVNKRFQLGMNNLLVFRRQGETRGNEEFVEASARSLAVAG